MTSVTGRSSVIVEKAVSAKACVTALVWTMFLADFWR